MPAAIVAERDLKHILHFTRVENLPSIFQHGLVPRATLEADGIDVATNDEYRYDGCLDASCLSISFPNYKMFYQLRRENPGAHWAVISVKPEILHAKECAFCITNAASNDVRCVPIDDRKGRDALLRLFQDYDGAPPRADLRIKDCYTTNPQAEVLVFDVIELQYINGVFFRDNEQMNAFKATHPTVLCKVSETPFTYRNDFQHWR